MKTLFRHLTSVQRPGCPGWSRRCVSHSEPTRPCAGGRLRRLSRCSPEPHNLFIGDDRQRRPDIDCLPTGQGGRRPSPGASERGKAERPAEMGRQSSFLTADCPDLGRLVRRVKAGGSLAAEGRKRRSSWSGGSCGFRRCPEHAPDALEWDLLKGWLCKLSWPRKMSRLVSRTPGLRFAGHQHRWMSSAA